MKRFSFAALALLLIVSVFAATDDWAQHGLYTSAAKIPRRKARR